MFPDCNAETVYHNDSAMSWGSMASIVEARVPHLESLPTDSQSIRDWILALYSRSCSPVYNLSMCFVYTKILSGNKALCARSGCDLNMALSSLVLRKKQV